MESFRTFEELKEILNKREIQDGTNYPIMATALINHKYSTYGDYNNNARWTLSGSCRVDKFFRNGNKYFFVYGAIRHTEYCYCEIPEEHIAEIFGWV